MVLLELVEFAGSVQKTWSPAVGTDACELENLHLAQVGREKLCMDETVELEKLVVAEKALLLVRAVENMRLLQ